MIQAHGLARTFQSKNGPVEAVRGVVDEELVVQARLYGIGARAAAGRAESLRTLLDLADVGGRQVKTMSGGQRRRLDIALGMVHPPRLLFLDEPSTGLDPQSRANPWSHIRALRQRDGVTVFLLGVSLSSLSYAAGLWLKHEDSLAPLLNSAALPIRLLSGILLPMSLAPAWLFKVSRLSRSCTWWTARARRSGAT